MPDLPTGTVTFLFTDIEGSTRLWEQHPEAMHAALARHNQLLHQTIEAHGGHVFKTVGDQFCAAFAAAPDALAAALAAQQALQNFEFWILDFGLPAGGGAETEAGAAGTSAESGLPVGPDPNPKSKNQNPKLTVRMALHTGTAQAWNGDYFGAPLSRVTRLLETGHGGQVLLSQPAYDLCLDHLPAGVTLRDMGEHRLRDLVRPERVFQIVHPELPADFPALRSLDVRPQNLPAQATVLIGREKEVAAVGELLRQAAVRLVTLIGPGGTGKTRLALQAAAEMLDDFRDGVFFVALAPISDPGLVASTIAQTLGLREADGIPLRDSLNAYLREKQLLLLLDNFEQVLPAAPLVAELLAAAPGLKLMATSRAALRLRGEKEFAVPPLSLPDPKRLPALEALSQYAAVALFIQRAVDVRPEFTVTNENAPAVAEICARLDGLPLAIELAAARIKLLPPQALLARLENRLKLLTGGARDLPARQQTLRGAIAWSCDLLEEPEKRLFRRLAVFVAGCTLEAAEAVCSADGDLEIDVLEGLASLVDKSLLQQNDLASGEPRFTMLETIREYGLEELEASGEAPAIRRQHAEFFLTQAERRETDVPARFARLERERDNLRAALAWCQEDSASGELGLRLAAALMGLWYWRGPASEAWRWLTAALAHPGAAARTVARGRVLWAAAIFAGAGRADPEVRRELGEESLAIARELGDPQLLGSVLRHLGQMAQNRGELDTAWRLTEESLAADREAGDQGGIAAGLGMLGLYAREQGETEKARAYMDESVARLRELGFIAHWGTVNRIQLAVEESDFVFARSLAEETLTHSRKLDFWWVTAQVLGQLGRMATYDGDYAAAKAFWDENLTLSWERGEGQRHNLPGSLEGLAALAAARGESERAACLWGAAAALRETPNHRPPAGSVGVPAADEPRLAAVRAALGEEAFTAAWAEGRALSPQQAVEYALQPEGTAAGE
jgi:predicted ATPase/class 3 adenylate cyclase